MRRPHRLTALALRPQERRQVASDRRVGFERQPQLAEAAGTLSGRLVAQLALRKEAVDQQLSRRLALDLDRNRSLDQLAAAAEHGDGMFFWAISRQQRLLGRAGGVP